MIMMIMKITMTMKMTKRILLLMNKTTNMKEIVESKIYYSFLKIDLFQ